MTSSDSLAAIVEPCVLSWDVETKTWKALLMTTHSTGSEGQPLQPPLPQSQEAQSQAAQPQLGVVAEGRLGSEEKTKKKAKRKEKLKNLFFHKNVFFHYFKLNLGGLGVSGGRAWTIRRDSLELWRGLVYMGEFDFHAFWKY